MYEFTHSTFKMAEYFNFYVEAWKKWTAQPGVLLLRYEDLLTDFSSILDQIINYLELNISVENKQLITEQYLPKQKSMAGIATHFEHGIAHRFRTEFDQTELDFLAQRYKSILESMGYEV